MAVPRIAAACLLAAFVACGTETSAAGDGEISDGPALAFGEVGSFTATVSGAKDTTYRGSTAAGNIESSGSCGEDTPLRVGFNLTGADGTKSGRFQVVTDRILEAEETGSFPVETVSFWYARAGLPPRVTFRGPGTLDITGHDARPGARRMEGRLVARGLEDSRGDKVDVEAEFALGLSCGAE